MNCYHSVSIYIMMLPVRQQVDLDIGVGSVPFEVDRGQVPTLLDADVEAATAEAVDEPKLNLAADRHRPVPPLPLAVH